MKRLDSMNRLAPQTACHRWTDLRGCVLVAVLAAVPLLAPATARADGVLVDTAGNRSFPTRVDISISVRAQIESTTVTLALPPIETQGSYSLTVPSPPGASAIGVDIDRGDGAGFVALPAVSGSPSAPGDGTDGAFSTWAGDAALVATLQDLAPGPLTARVRFIRMLRRVNGQVAFEVGARRCPWRPVSDAGPMTSLDLDLETSRDLARFEASGAIVETGLRGGHLTTGLTNGDVIVGVTYAEVQSGINVQLVTHRTPTSDPMGGDAGYFLLLVDADPQPSTMPRAISLVIDHSGSMSGDKIAQARDAARAMLDYLDPTDSFTIHQFDDEVDSFRSAPVLATPDNIDAARGYIKGIDADGSTDLNGGLQAALTAPAVADRFDATVLLSDGMATAGETDDKTILANAWRASANHTRIFTFSVGSDADFPLMEALARGSRGRHVDLNNAQATRDLVIRARELFEDIRDVRLTDLDMQVSSIGLTDTLPEHMPDLFSGGQILVVGRYTTPGAGEVHITGMEGTLPFERTFVVDAPVLDESNDIIKYVWATEKVRTLMASIADGANAEEVHQQVEAIGLAYRIQTPYTHYDGSGSGDNAGCSVAGPAASMWVVVLGLVVLRGRRRRRHPAHP